jgi:hypothetical protein
MQRQYLRNGHAERRAAMDMISCHAPDRPSSGRRAQGENNRRYGPDPLLWLGTRTITLCADDGRQQPRLPRLLAT